MADEQPVIDPIDPLVDPPLRTEAPADFTPKADRFLAALPAMVRQFNAAIAKMNSLATWLMTKAKGYADAASGSATAAEQSAQYAAAKADAAKTSADSSASSLASSRVVQSAVEQSAGLPPGGDIGSVLRIKNAQGEKEWWKIQLSQVGDTILSTQAPDSTWIPTGATYPQSSYPALFAKLGKLPDFRDDQFTTSGLPGGSSTMTAGMPGYGNGTLFVMGVPSATNSYSFHYSKNLGASWTSLNKAANYYVNAMAFGNNVFVGPDQGGNLANVFDTTTNQYTAYSLPSQSTWTLAAFGNNTFICAMNNIGTNNYAYSTDNGKTWTPRTGPTDLQPGALIFFNGSFLLFDGRSVDYYYASTDGINWAKRFLPTSMFVTLRTLTINGNTLALISGLNLYKTNNGSSWTASLNTNPISTTQSGGIYFSSGDGVYVIFTDVAAGGKVYYSVDGVVWGFRNKQLTPSSATTLGSLPIFAAGNFVFFVQQAQYMWRIKPYSYNTSALFYSLDAPAYPQVGLTQYIKAA